jgi:hypothetical protein
MCMLQEEISQLKFIARSKITPFMSLIKILRLEFNYTHLMFFFDENKNELICINNYRPCCYLNDSSCVILLNYIFENH